jgi:predicted nucleotidyltransferase
MARAAVTTLKPRRRARRRPRTQIEPLLPRIRKILGDLYGDRLVSVILYGSFARDKATEDSDIDIAVVLKGKVDWFKENRRINDALYELELEAEELISVFPVTPQKLSRSDWPLYCHVRKEGIKI